MNPYKIPEILENAIIFLKNVKLELNSMKII